MEKEPIRAKRRARRMALQALYQWHMSTQPAYEVEAQFKVLHNLERVDVPYFSYLFNTSTENINAIDAVFRDFLDRELSALNPVELAIIRLSACELLFCPELPWRVILDEAVNVGREYGSTDGHKYVNGILNKVARKVRAVEIKMDDGSQ